MTEEKVELMRCSCCKCKMLPKFFAKNPKTDITYKTCDNCRNKYKCEHCGYKCERNFDLENHINTVHLKRQNFKCKHCDQAFGLASGLKRHIEVVHLKQKNYKCEHCDLSFGENSTLQTHIKVCTGSIRCSSGELKVMQSLEAYGFEKDIDYFFDETYEVKDKRFLKWDFRILTTGDPIFIEYDGEYHSLPIRYGGISQERAELNLKNAKRRDKIKDDYCTDNCFLLLRIPYWEKENTPELVTEFLNTHLY